MQSVPKIVRQRLKAATPASNHPDANVLTAFAERSLAEGERAVVLEHLGRCSDCRDIVALALPATEPVQTIVSPSRSGWLTWPPLRWGLVAAGVVAIAALGLVQYQRGVRSQSIASTAPARFEVAAKEARNQPLAPPVPVATAKADNFQSPPPSASTDSVGATDATLNEKKITVRAEVPRASVPQPQVGVGRGSALAVGGPLPHGPRLANQWQQQNDTQKQAPAVPSPFAKQQAAGDLSANMRVPAVSETVAVESQSAQLETQTQNLDAGQIQDQPAAALPSNEDYARIGKAKPAATTQTATTTSPASTMAAPIAQGIGSGALALSAPIPRWTINSTGGLQRSFDQGATWQAVNVNANPAYFTDETSLQISGKTSQPKVRKIAPIFRAVAATGIDVWAGGSGGAIYHSLDAGDHWTRVELASAGSTLTGDIVSLEFLDIQHGKVTTSTTEVWTTSNSGQTWQKQ